jgi:uncharacterized protein (TIGR00369 family)
VTDGTDLMREFIPNSPFAAQLGLRLEHIADGEATVVMPFAPEIATAGDTVHGGAISTLADVAVMAAAWAGAPLPERLQGATVSLSVVFVAPAKAEDLAANARVLRRGGSLTFAECDVTGADGRAIAKVVGTYKLG